MRSTPASSHRRSVRQKARPAGVGRECICGLGAIVPGQHRRWRACAFRVQRGGNVVDMASERPGGDDEPETNENAGEPFDGDATEAVSGPHPPAPGGVDPDATEAVPGPPPETGEDLTQPLHDFATGTTAESPAPPNATVFGAPPVVDPAAAVDQVGQDRLQEELDREARAHRRRRRTLITALVIAIVALSIVAIWLIASGGDDDDGDDETPGTTTSVTTETTTTTDSDTPGGNGPVVTPATSSTTTPSTSSTTTPSTSSTTVQTTSSTVVPPTSPPVTTTEPPPTDPTTPPDTSDPDPDPVDPQG